MSWFQWAEWLHQGILISTPASKIIASPSTLTGSIGIFGVINYLENSLESIGVHSDGVSTSLFAGLSVTNKLPEDFQSYSNLILKVAIKHS